MAAREGCGDCQGERGRMSGLIHGGVIPTPSASRLCRLRSVLNRIPAIRSHILFEVAVWVRMCRTSTYVSKRNE